MPEAEQAVRDLLEAGLNAIKRGTASDQLAAALKLIAIVDPNTVIEIIGNLLQPTLESLDSYQRIRLLGHLSDLADPPNA